MVQPLKQNIPPFCLSIFGTDNKFTANEVTLRWQYIKEKLQEIKIRVVGVSTDGDSRCLKAMKIQTGIGNSFNDSDNIFKNQDWYAADFDASFVCIQDPIHIATKLRNRLLKPSIFLQMGKTLVSKTHLLTLIQTVPKDVHMLCESLIQPKDRQNYQSAFKTTRSQITEMLKQHVPGSKATALYLDVCRWTTDSFLDKEMLPLDRLLNMWKGVFVIRGWYSSIRRNKLLSTTDNFLTSNAYACIEINAHGLINLISRTRYSPEIFLTPLFSSQPCESLFRQIRSMSTTFSTQVIIYLN